jgi:zinc protease
MPAKMAAVIVLSVLWCSPSGAAIRDSVTDTRLSNGLKVIMFENRKAPLVTFQVWYRVGSRNEQWHKTGLSHVLEHMMFKGTPAVPGPEFSRIIQENGGNYNAFTSSDFTAYFATMRADRIGSVVELEADRMRSLIISEEDFSTERMVVMEERRQRTEDNPKSILVEQLHAVAFVQQPYRWPIIGWMEDLQRLTREDLRGYYDRYYCPANAFIVIAGDFQREEMLRALEKTFGVLPAGSAPEDVRFVDPPQSGEKRIVVKKEAKLPAVVMGYRVPNYRERDAYVLEVIEALLAEGKSSRLYESLVRKHRLALGVYAGNSLLSLDPDLFMVSAECMPGVSPRRIEAEIDREIARLRTVKVTPRELAKAKNLLEASFVFSQDSIFSQAMLTARYEIAGDWHMWDEYLKRIREVTGEDITRVAKKYFTRDGRTVAILEPLTMAADRPSPQDSFNREAVR